MTKKMNCWEYKKCGRGPRGARTKDLGVCQAATFTSINGVNGGVNGGRMCWAIVGIYSFTETKGTFSRTDFHCYECEFHRRVLTEEGIVKPGMLKEGEQE